MDRKYECSAKISVIIFFLLLCIFHKSAYSQKDVVSQYDQDISVKSSALDSIKSEIEKGRVILTGLQKDEGNYLERIEQIEKNINASRTYLEMLGERIDSVEAVIEILKDSLAIAQKDLENRKIVMKKRLCIAYKRISVHPLLLLIRSKNPVEFINRTRYLQDINRYDHKLLENINYTRKLIDKKTDLLKIEKESLAELLITKKNEQLSLIKEEQLRKSMLEDIRSKKLAYIAMIGELEAAQQQLNTIIKQLEEKRKKAKKELSSSAVGTAFEKRKGKLSWPVKGPVVSNFGKVVHPVYKTVTMNNGIDIGASKGQQVQCVAPGTVIHTGWMRGLGQIVIIDHASGYLTVYAHLQDILVSMDQTVEFGTTLGKVGDTGSLGGARLHFEIRKSTDAFDPSEWLEK